MGNNKEPKWPTTSKDLLLASDQELRDELERRRINKRDAERLKVTKRQQIVYDNIDIFLAIADEPTTKARLEEARKRDGFYGYMDIEVTIRNRDELDDPPSRY